MKRVKIPVSYSVCGYVYVEVPDYTTLEEAVEVAKDKIDELPLEIYDYEYIDGTYEINDDMDVIEYINQRG